MRNIQPPAAASRRGGETGGPDRASREPAVGGSGLAALAGIAAVVLAPCVRCR